MSAAQSNQPDHGQRPASRTSAHRLAEMVAGLTGCSIEQAVAAVEAVQTEEAVDSDAALEVVARAMSAIRLVDLRDKVDLRDTSEQHTPIS